MLFSLLLCGFSMRMKNAVNYIFLRKTQWRLKEKKSHYNTQSFVWTSKPITYVCKQPNTRKHTSVHHAGTNNGYAHDTQTYWYHITQLTQPGKIFQGLCAYWKSLGWPDPGNPEQLGPWSCSAIDGIHGGAAAGLVDSGWVGLRGPNISWAWAEADAPESWYRSKFMPANCKKECPAVQECEQSICEAMDMQKKRMRFVVICITSIGQAKSTMPWGFWGQCEITCCWLCSGIPWPVKFRNHFIRIAV